MSLKLSHAQLIAAAEKFGTPLYVYHAERIREQYEKLTAAFAGMNTRFFYASKALTNINVLRYVQHIGSSIDCSSINEVKLALYAGIPKEKILYTSNGISCEEIHEAKEAGVFINIDSLSNLEKFGAAYGNSYPVGVRVRPNIMAGGNLKISTGHDRSKLGIPVDQMDQILALREKYNIHIAALHIHTGSEIKDAAVFVQGVELLLDAAPSFPDLSIIDLGGGFKVPYRDNEEGTDLNLLARELKACFDRHSEVKGQQLQVWFEPGKFMVSQAGYFVTKVNVLKTNPNAQFAGIDTGLNHLIRPMFYDAYHKIENISNPNGTAHPYMVTGNICETDTFAADRALSEIREGDLLVFYNAGAYCYEMASNYNSRYRPAEVMFVDDIPHLIRKRETFEDLLRNQIDINSEK